MSILSELKKSGITVTKTDNMFRGFYTTEKGIVVSRMQSACEDGIYFLQKEPGKTYPCSDIMVYIASGTEYEGKIHSKAEADQLVNEGKIFSFKSSDLYSEFYDFNNNQELKCIFEHPYSSRSRKYIESVMKSIGLISYTDACNSFTPDEGEPTEFDVTCSYRLYFDAPTEVGKLSSGLWIAQTCYRVSIDDFAVIKMYFDHNPSEENLRTAFAIRAFELKPIEVFTCHECGHMMNWLELEGDIEEKYNMASENYCGC